MSLFLTWWKNERTSVKVASAVVVLLLFVALFAPWLSPYSFEEQNIDIKFQGPSFLHPMGVDELGRDLLSRLIYGCRVSMSIALFTALTSVVVGALYGSLSGYVGGWLDKAMMRFVDILNTLPVLMVMILVMLVFGRDILGIFIALTLTGWLGTARIMRAQMLSWKNRPFIEAARALGVKDLRIVFRHIFPNTVAPLIVELSYQIPTNVLTEAFLGFLGIGVPPPTPSWGILADSGRKALMISPHIAFFSGLAIFLAMLSFQTLGDALRDRLDPFLKGQR